MYTVTLDFLYNLWFTAYSQALVDNDKDLTREAFAATMKEISKVPHPVLDSFVNEFTKKHDQLEGVTTEVS